MLIYAHNGYAWTFKMGLSRILKSFSAISFTWFYLFIMLENVEAKIGRHNFIVHTRRFVVRHKIVMCI